MEFLTLVLCPPIKLPCFMCSLGVLDLCICSLVDENKEFVFCNWSVYASGVF